MWNKGVSRETDRILIVALDSGAGHRVRMGRLKLRLEALGFQPAFHIVSDGGDVKQKVLSNETWSLIVLDARDTDPGIFVDVAPVLAIDNMHSKRRAYERRSDIVFYDTLPHPGLDADYDSICRSILFDDEVIERAVHIRRSSGPETTRITFYAGHEAFLSQETVNFIDQQMRSSDSILYTRIGGPQARTYHIPYLGRPRFLDLLMESTFVLTYPGMTFWEALVLGAIPVLVETGSHVHDELGAYLARRVGVRLLRYEEMRYGSAVEMILDGMTRSLSMDVDSWKRDVAERPGMRQLVRIVEELLNDFGKPPSQSVYS